jgi:2-keto-4-pentenoate hydratase/2-oxohepta-3-ene-1,7-dioic acid hydratase in catechol pathway
MAVTVVRYMKDGATRWGVVRDGKIVEVDTQSRTTGEFVSAWPLATLAQAQGATLRFDEVAILSPVTQNQQFVCLGANYRQHMIESGIDPDVKRFNMMFTKASNCIVPANSDVVRPTEVKFLDYEIELGVVMRSAITARRNVTEADLPDLIAGLTIVNDYSARDIQIPQMQFYKGKSFRTFGPVGPYLVLLAPEDFRQLNALDLTLTVNGTVRQKDNTRNLVFKVPETLTELSGVHDLAPGDLIATGTPAGCALTVPPPAVQRIMGLFPERKKWEFFLKKQASRPQYLKSGDVVEARIVSADGRIDLGCQRNRIVDEAAR